MLFGKTGLEAIIEGATMPRKQMDNYAKEKAVAFLEWSISEGWVNYDGHDTWKHGKVVLSSKQLYDHFEKVNSQ